MKNIIAALFLACLFLSAAAFAGDVNQPSGDDVVAIRMERDAAIESVKKIVNQPITHVKRDASKHPSEYSPGWFHKGAIRPDFLNVDVRQTQQVNYGSGYVTSDVNPDEMFLGPELEFNRMTKFFYTDRNLPKKKLTEEEMLEINRLYRIIGADEAKLTKNKIETTEIPKDEEFFATPQGKVCILVGLLLVGYFVVTNKRTT